MVKTLHGAAEVFIDRLEQTVSGEFYQEKNPDYGWGFGSSLEPLRHLIVNMTGAPTQVAVQAQPNGVLAPIPHPAGEPQVIVELQQGAAIHLGWNPPFENP